VKWKPPFRGHSRTLAQARREYPRAMRRRLRTSGFALVGGALLATLSGCGHHASRAVMWTSCPRPSSAADIRRFKVRGGEKCRHASRVLGYTAFGHEGSCGDACGYHGYTCRQRPGGLKSNSSGGSYYTYEDDACVRGLRQAAWRIVAH
jgi:hypothetical protein